MVMLLVLSLISTQPLTDLGVEQAKALGRSLLWRDQSSFWRIYSSDLKRTRHTTQLLLKSMLQSSNVEKSGNAPLGTHCAEYDPNDPVGSVGVFFDPRLREVAKGARQGLPKSIRYAQALEERERKIESRELPANEAIPLLESDDDGWARVEAWLREVADDVIHDVRINFDPCGGPKSETAPKVYTVMAIAHAALYRVFFERLLGDERLRAHPDATCENSNGRIVVPNTSLTILDVYIDTRIRDRDNDVGVSTDVGLCQRLTRLSIAHIDIVLLTSTEHYGDIRPYAVD